MNVRKGSLFEGEEGFVLVFVAVAIPALLGLVGLAIDGTLLASRDAELAGLADAAALAAANKLDRSVGAIASARVAVVELSGRSGGRDAIRLRFASNLGQLRADPAFSLADASGAEATVVEVIVDGASPPLSFLTVVGAGPRKIERRASAESRYYACDVTPMALCQADPASFAANARPGRQYLLRMEGTRIQGSILPLDRSDLPGGRQTLVSLASDSPRFCLSDGVRLRTNIAPAEFDAALNVRFDRYATRNGPVAPDLAVFPPAPSIIQGKRLESCAADPGGGDVYPPYRLPRDSAYSGLALNGPWNGGGADWKTAPPFGGIGASFGTALDEYLAWNHGDKSPAVRDALGSAPTRYELYLRELGLTSATDGRTVNTRSLDGPAATLPTGGPRSGSLAQRSESPIPICYTGPGRADQPRRRIVYLAVVDCGAFPQAARAETLSRYVAKFFLTEPSDGGILLAEFQGMLAPQADDGKFRHAVELVETR